jgi:hypothetical protein
MTGLTRDSGAALAFGYSIGILAATRFFQLVMAGARLTAALIPDPSTVARIGVGVGQLLMAQSALARLEAIRLDQDLVVQVGPATIRRARRARRAANLR